MHSQHARAASTSDRRQRGLTLIELITAMSIAFLLTGMVLLSWFSLQDSYSQTTRAGEARDKARDSMSRVVREIRDAQAAGGSSSIVSGTPWRVDLYTTFNAPGDVDAGFGDVHLTRFQYDATNDQLLRLRDTDGNGTFDRTTVLADHVVNSSGEPMFSYWTYATNGYPVNAAYVFANTKAVSLVYAVEIRVVTDLNPGSPPAPVDITSTAQLRNARPL
jgi:Tfp pilus assembly protein PilW